MMESLSGSELNMEGQGGVLGNELDNISGDLLNQNQSQPPGSKKNRYHRHTIHQIQEMEAYAYFNFIEFKFNCHITNLN